MTTIRASDHCGSNRRWAELLWRVLRLAGVRPAPIVIILSLSLLMVALESFSIILLQPLFELAYPSETGSNAASAPSELRILRSSLEAIGVPVTFPLLVALVVGLVAIRQIAAYLLTVSRATLTHTTTVGIWNCLFSGMLASGFGFFDKTTAGSASNIIFGESKRVSYLLTCFIGIFVSAIRLAVYAVAMSTISAGASALSLIVILALLMFFLRRILTATLSVSRKVTHSNETITSFALEMLAGNRTLRLYGRQASAADDFSLRSASILRSNVSMAERAARLDVVLEFALISAVILLVAVAASLSGLNATSLAVILALGYRMLPLAKEIAANVFGVVSAAGSVERIDRVLELARMMQEPNVGAIPFHRPHRAIEFVSVSFDYPSLDPAVPRSSRALDRTSFSIPANRTTALIGVSGSGKSTAMDIIARLRVPSEGRVEIDGVPLETISLVDFRQNVGMLTQDVLLFNTSVIENIRLGMATASVDDVVAAAKAARAHEFIERLPNGYDTVVGERGALVSGGQKQRIAIARALVRRAPILLLDEPTSALDSETEQAIQATLADLQAGGDTTIVIIAHRLSTVRHADHIVVLDKGRVLGAGTHDELMASAPWYRHIVELQLAPEAGMPAGAA